MFCVASIRHCENRRHPPIILLGCVAVLLTWTGFVNAAGPVHLDFRGRDLDDRLVEALSKADGLSSLSLSDTEIDDRQLSKLQMIPTIESLVLENCKINVVSMKSLSRFPSLRRLDLTGSTVDGRRALKALANFPKLQALILMCNDSDDDDLADIAACVTLRELSVNSPLITNRGLGEIQKLRDLEALAVNGGRLTDDGFAVLRNIPHLRSLSLRGGGLTLRCLDHVAVPDALQFLSLAGVQVPADATDILQKFTGLSELRLCCAVGDREMAAIGRMKKLRALSLAGSDVSPGGVQIIAGCKGLEVLDLRYTSLAQSPAAMKLIRESLPRTAVLPSPATEQPQPGGGREPDESKKAN